MIQTLFEIELLAAIAVLFQSVENWRARKFWNCLFEQQRWHHLFLFQFFSALLLIAIDSLLLWGFHSHNLRGSHYTLYSEVISIESLSLLRVFLILIMLKVTIAVPLLLRGPMNGGSDSMTALVLLSLLVAAIWPTPKVLLGAIGFIGLQAVWSYVMAGWVKIKEPTWRQGRALNAFLNRNRVYTNQILFDSTRNEIGQSMRVSDVLSASQTRTLMMLLSWLIMIFELSFFVVFAVPSIVFVYLSLGVAFHLANVYFFGLNRFFWIWLATYPAIFYLSKLEWK